MLTPVDLQNKVFKGGIGFDKKDVAKIMGGNFISVWKSIIK